ncbi:hypothetical protein ACFC5Z_42965 [Streptomyces sp. NPDC056004]|uniref:hypothetical protein n=1 Tax=Streptomyces sp. NPDC056004 TaxID=3345677 RepID=UPI0035D9852B
MSSLAELNEMVEQWNRRDDARRIGSRSRPIAADFALDQPLLMPLPQEPFETGRMFVPEKFWRTFRESGGRVSSDRQTGAMRIESVVRIQAVRLAVSVGAVVAAPVLLMAGAPLRHRMLRGCYREDGPGLVSKEDSWVSPGYFVATNLVVRALCWPSEYVLQRCFPA